MRQAKAVYYQEAFNLAKNNIKQTWTLLRSAIRRKHDYIELPEYFKQHNTTITDKNKIADQFNTFFANNGNKISDTVPPSDHNFHKYLNRPNNYSLYFDAVDTCDIIEITSKLKTKTSQWSK